MIHLPARALPAELQTMLDAQQADIDELPDHAARVEAADRAWKRKPRRPFEAIRTELRAMSSGGYRCVYCEDSKADEIEHTRPKSLYPEQTFRWQNYLFACGPCNGPKNNHFPVLSAQTGRIVDVARTRRSPVVPTEDGRMMLIDPRQDDPLRFLSLDLVSSFFFGAQPRRRCVARARAVKTIEVLRLNEDPHPRRRADAYGNYLARLKEYVVEQDAARRERQQRALTRLDHPTVWLEMQRQHLYIPELRPLFAQAPEALRWQPLRG